MTKKRWMSHFQSQKSSGISIKRYCRQHGLKPGQFYYWKKRLDFDDDNQSSGFVEVVPAKNPVSALIVKFPGDVTVEISRGADISILKDLTRNFMILTL